MGHGTRRYFFGIADGKKIVRDRVGTELANLLDVQSEALEFARKVLSHRFSYGIEDPSECNVVVGNETGRVLTKISLRDVKRRQRSAA